MSSFLSSRPNLIRLDFPGATPVLIGLTTPQVLQLLETPFGGPSLNG